MVDEESQLASAEEESQLASAEIEAILGPIDALEHPKKKTSGLTAIAGIIRRIMLPLVFVAGLMLGWVYLGWVVFPVEWSDTDPWDLRPHYQRWYIRLVAQDLSQTGNMARAEEALAGWNAHDLHALLQQLAAESASPEEQQHLQEMQESLAPAGPRSPEPVFDGPRAVVFNTALSALALIAAVIIAGGLIYQQIAIQRILARLPALQATKEQVEEVRAEEAPAEEKPAEEVRAEEASEDHAREGEFDFSSFEDQAQRAEEQALQEAGGELAQAVQQGNQGWVVGAQGVIEQGINPGQTVGEERIERQQAAVEGQIREGQAPGENPAQQGQGTSGEQTQQGQAPGENPAQQGQGTTGEQTQQGQAPGENPAQQGQGASGEQQKEGSGPDKKYPGGTQANGEATEQSALSFDEEEEEEVFEEEDEEGDLFSDLFEDEDHNLNRLEALVDGLSEVDINELQQSSQDVSTDLKAVKANRRRPAPPA